ncbi:YmfQ family protein [Pseudomonas fluorescens]|uniref:Phage tail protein n=1 Tax=Pseudomonas fluorescens TaxID=294 RepID=A0A5E7Q524_PSEFL|nr:YmfQ family protein [Pseudomonas fluorescens]VVP56981.1 hypothetical protein PS880_05771 [Pseudomonas fluorescens]
MAYSADEYRNQLAQLLPPGFAIPAYEGTEAYLLLDGIAQELARLDGRAETLIKEANPATTTELLPDWERVAGLPDCCSNGEDSSVEERRRALLAKLTATGGQSAAYFIEVAAALGYTITITEFHPFRVGMSQVGQALSNEDWIYTWRVNAPEQTVTTFKVGLSTVGDPLASWGNDLLECYLNKIKPAHTILLFGYGGA